MSLKVRLGFAECCPLARVRIYAEELRTLRTALQLMVQRQETGGTAAVSGGPDSCSGGSRETTKASDRSDSPPAPSAQAGSAMTNTNESPAQSSAEAHADSQRADTPPIAPVGPPILLFLAIINNRCVFQLPEIGSHTLETFIASLGICKGVRIA